MTTDIPQFLRLTKEERAAAWKNRKLTEVKQTSRKRNWHLPKTMDEAAWAMLRQQERAAKARTKERLAALKASKA